MPGSMTMNKIKCNYKTRFFVINKDEVEFYLPHYENIMLIQYDNIAQIWNQIYENQYVYNEDDEELLQALIESGVIN